MESFEERGFVGRQNEEAERGGHRAFHIAGALHIDVEHDQRALRKRVFHLIAQCAVPTSAKHLCVFEKATFIDPLLECLFIDEVVIDAVAFAAAAFTRRCAHAELAAETTNDFMHNRGLAHTAWTADDEEKTVLVALTHSWATIASMERSRIKRHNIIRINRQHHAIPCIR